MNKQTRTFALIPSIALALLATVSHAAPETQPQQVTDARQETQIWTTYALNPYLRANDLTVVVHDGTATLTGKVAEGVNKELAKQIAEGVVGIKSVDNQIIVQADYMPPVPSTDRGYGEMIDDATIATAIKSKLVWSKYTSAMATGVDSQRGKVTLTGTTNSGPAKDLAGRLAMNTRDVISVDNQLIVDSSKPTIAENAESSVSAVGQSVADGWITTKVKSTFLYSSYVDSADIGVNTKGGVVTLRGKLSNGTERALAIELAKNVRGVKNVRAGGLTY